MSSVPITTAQNTNPSNSLTLSEALGRCKTVRQKIYTYLLDPEVEDNKHGQVDGWISLLIIFNLFALCLLYTSDAADE